eukprot:12383988-Prorocentrum_lima.AAC.1
MLRLRRSWAVLLVDVSSAFTHASWCLLFASLQSAEEVGLDLALARKAVFRTRSRLRDNNLAYRARAALVHALIVSWLPYGSESWPQLP